MDQREIAWFAGLYEGEGWIGNPRPNVLQIRIGSTDYDVLLKAQRVFDRGRIFGPYTAKKHPNRKPYWQLDFSTRPAYAVALMILPHLGVRRTLQVRDAVIQWLSIPGWGK